jgi:diguanylate cyclase (GGDEF)-like protein/PAS domain S-box-containing protein
MVLKQSDAPSGLQRSFGKLTYLPFPLAITVGLLLTALSFFMVRDWETERARHAFREAASQRIRILQENFENGIEKVESLRDFFVASNFEPSTAAITRYVEPALERHPAIRALGWNRLVTEAEREKFETGMQSGYPGYRITERDADKELIPAARRPDYAPVTQIIPLKGNEAAMGYDIFSDPVRRQAIELARDTGQTMATGRIRLVQEAGEQYGFLVFSPLYRAPLTSGGPPLRERFLGVAAGVLRASDLVDKAPGLTSSSVPALSITLLDMSAPANDRLLYANSPDAATDATALFDSDVLRAEEAINLAGRDWRVLVTSVKGTSYSAGASWFSYLALLTGLLFTTLFGLVSKRTATLRQTNDKLINEATERHLAEQALRESESQLRLVTNAVPAVIAYIDNQSRVRFHNKAFNDWASLPDQDLTGQPLLELLPEENFALSKGALEAALRGEKQNYERAFQRPGQPRLHTMVNLVPHKDENGKVLGVFSLVTDITARKKMEDDLAAEKERAQVTLASIGEGVITADANGKLLYMNPVAEELIGWKTAEALGKPVTDVLQFLSESEREPIENPLLQCLRERRVIGLDNQSVLLRRDGSEYPVDDSTAPILDRNGNTLGAVLVFSDVSQQRFLARQLTHQASHDALTGLINRREFEERLKRLIAETRENKSHHVLCYMDLDQFKVVNDTCGHVAGDALLRQISAAFEKELRHSDTLARLGGDEFGVLLEHCPTEQAMHIANQMLMAARDLRFTWNGRVFPIGVSIGVVAITSDIESHSELMRSADAACYAAKDRGRNRVQLFQHDDSLLARRTGDMQWFTRIGHALEENRFVLFGQPIRALSDNPVEGAYAEVLVRLRGEDGQLISPGSFIPAAERYSLMPQLDRWVVVNAIAWYAKQLHEGGVSNIPSLGINLSGASVSDPGFLEFVRTTLKARDVPAQALCFEITETAAITHLKQAVRFINELRETGCRFALDDFGSGMSSFAYLKNLPVNFIKIDGNFVRNMHEDVVDLAMTEAINRIGHVMNIPTIAESVENQVTMEMLEELGVNYAQGYHVGRPMPLDQLLVVPTIAIA